VYSLKMRQGLSHFALAPVVQLAAAAYDESHPPLCGGVTHRCTSRHKNSAGGRTRQGTGHAPGAL
jgi:hypothetical protein